MSPVGHSLVGLAFSAVILPRIRPGKWRIGLPLCFIALANLPDWPLPNWGHDRYDISHSVYVNVLLIALVAVAWRSISRFRASVRPLCFFFGAGAWLSHLLLDSFYNHGNGIGIFWPFSNRQLNFAMPWFNTLDLSQSPISKHNLSRDRCWDPIGKEPGQETS